MHKLKVLELFAGLGACSKALEKLNIPHEIIDAVEIDKYAIKSFNAIHGTNFELQDITKWDKDIEVDLLCHGSPCQSFSLAGLQHGGDKDSGTRSSLMWETVRIVEKSRPKYIIWENVKNLLSKKHRHNFDAYLETMEKLGYKNHYQVLNAKDYGVPQNRERIFTISIRDDVEMNFTFPQKQPLKLKLRDLLDENVDEKYYLSDTQINRIKQSTYIQNRRRIQEKDYCDTLCARDWKDPKCVEVKRKYGIFDTEKSTHQAGSVYDENGLSPTLDTMQGGYRQPCVETIDNQDQLELKIRKITPKECFRLMGFDDEDFERAQNIPTSNTQLYKQAGNSIVVNVLESIFKELFKDYIPSPDRWSDLN